MIRVYLDASVIIAALLSPTGGSAKLLEFVKLGAVAGVVSQTVIDEVEEHSFKIRKSHKEIRKFIQENSIIVRERIDEFESAPFKDLIEEEDIHVVAGARLTKCDYLVTLDKKHLLKEEVKKILKPLKVVAPKEILLDLTK